MEILNSIWNFIKSFFVNKEGKVRNSMLLAIGSAVVAVAISPMVVINGLSFAITTINALFLISSFVAISSIFAAGYAAMFELLSDEAINNKINNILL